MPIIDLLNEVVDKSELDLDEPQVSHLLQTAETIRKDYQIKIEWTLVPFIWIVFKTIFNVDM